MGRHTFRRRKHSRRTLKQRGGATDQQLENMREYYSRLKDTIENLKKTEQTLYKKYIEDVEAPPGATAGEQTAFSKQTDKIMLSADSINRDNEEQYISAYNMARNKTAAYIESLCKKLTEHKTYIAKFPLPANVGESLRTIDVLGSSPSV